MYICVCVHAHSYLTLYHPVDGSLSGSIYMGFLRQKYWSGLPFPSPGDLPKLGIDPISPAWQADSLLLSQRKKTFMYQRSCSMLESKVTNVIDHYILHSTCVW